MQVAELNSKEKKRKAKKQVKTNMASRSKCCQKKKNYEWQVKIKAWFAKKELLKIDVRKGVMREERVEPKADYLSYLKSKKKKKPKQLCRYIKADLLFTKFSLVWLKASNIGHPMRAELNTQLKWSTHKFYILRYAWKIDLFV